MNFEEKRKSDPTLKVPPSLFVTLAKARADLAHFESTPEEEKNAQDAIQEIDYHLSYLRNVHKQIQSSRSSVSSLY